MILAGLHASQGMDGKGHIVLAFAVAAAAALSLENPFLRESGIILANFSVACGGNTCMRFRRIHMGKLCHSVTIRVGAVLSPTAY